MAVSRPSDLQTDRLVLNELAPEDGCDLFTVRGDPEAMAFWDWPADSDVAATAVYVHQILEEVRAGHARHWTVRLRIARTFVGMCDLSQLLSGQSADLGFLFARRYWGRGLAQEAVERILGYARDIGLKYIYARVHDRNERSIRLLDRLGFSEAKAIPQLEIRPGVFRDCRRYNKRL